MTKRILKVIDKYDQKTLPPTVKKLEKLVGRVETLFKDVSTDIMTVHDVSDIAEICCIPLTNHQISKLWLEDKRIPIFYLFMKFMDLGPICHV